MLHSLLVTSEAPGTRMLTLSIDHRGLNETSPPLFASV